MPKLGDIVLVHGTGFVDRTIQLASDSYWNHGALYAGTAWGQGFVFEAQFQEVRAYPWYHFQSLDKVILRPTKTDVGRAAVTACKKYLGDFYDVMNYPGLLLKGLKRRFPFLPFKPYERKNGEFYCFELVARAYRDVGYPLTDNGLVLPMDFEAAVHAGLLTVAEGELRS